MGRPFKCPIVVATNQSGKGIGSSREGKVRLRKCKLCNRKFVTYRKVPV